MAINNDIKARFGFTLVELIVVIAIIAMLIGLLVPSIQSVKRIASNLEQKSMFHGIEIGLEAFRKDFGDFPDSRRKQDNGAGPYYTGAQHLAEAMVGRDSRGFEPSQQSGRWYWPGDASSPAGLYDPADSVSLSRRKSQYIDLKGSGTFIPGELYGDPADPTVAAVGDVVSINNDQRAPVITDLFYKKKVETAMGELVKVGSPILYFKANRKSREFHRDSSGYGSDWIYNYDDNADVIDLGTIKDQAVVHDMDADNFYLSISDLNAPVDSPMNENTFILISAGYDGIYGTKDDVTNIKIK